MNAKLRPYLAPLLLTLLVALLYGHTLNVPWYLDDHLIIVDRLSGTGPGLTLTELFSPRGVATLSFALNHRLTGLSLPGFHLVNSLIHLACGGLVVLLLRRVFRDAPAWPLWGGLLFVAHPLQTQAVTYTVQRMTSLSALFFLLSLWLLVRFCEGLLTGASFRSPRNLGLYCGSLASCILAFGTKENTVVLPLALLLFCRFFLPEIRWRPLLAAIAPFLALALALIATRMLALSADDTSLLRLAGTQPLAHLQGNAPLRYLFTEFSVYWIYLRLLFVPWGQAFEHAYPLVKTLVSAQTVIAGAGLLALGVLAWRLRSFRPRISFAIAWFFLTLAVESSIIPLDPLFEHRLYLPLFGFVVALLDLATLLPRRRLAQGLLLAVLAVYALLTWQRNALWNDPVALYEESLRAAPENERTLINLSSEYLAVGKIDAAEEMARRALAINPDCAYAYRNLGRIALDRHDPAAALPSLEKGATFTELAVSEEIYKLLAEAWMQLGEPSRAMPYLKTALAYRPEASTYINLGIVTQILGRWQEAEESLRAALVLEPDNPLAHTNLARLLRQRGRSEEALAEYAIALRLTPQRQDLRNEAEQIRKLLAE